MRSAFHEMPTATLRALADALRLGRLQAPVTSAGLARVGIYGVPAGLEAEIDAGLMGFGGAGLAWGLDRLVAEREAHLAARPELVWTGPETPGTGGRDTNVVVEELFRSAERSVLVATYAIYQGTKVFARLADRMTARPDLSVRLFVNIPRPAGCSPNVSDAHLVRTFAERFAAEEWPTGVRLPDLFYDPRSLSPGPGPKACLHAKCIVVDDRRVFVTSANFTEAAQERNIEAGVLAEDAGLARGLRDQLESLVTAGLLKGIPRAA